MLLDQIERDHNLREVQVRDLVAFEMIFVRLPFWDWPLHILTKRYLLYLSTGIRWSLSSFGAFHILDVDMFVLRYWQRQGMLLYRNTALPWNGLSWVDIWEGGAQGDCDTCPRKTNESTWPKSDYGKVYLF